MAKNISLLGADYPDVPAVQLPQTGGGTATFYDIDVTDESSNITNKNTQLVDPVIKKTGHVADIKITTQNSGVQIADGTLLVTLGSGIRPYNERAYSLFRYDNGKPVNGCLWIQNNGNITYYGDTLSTRFIFSATYICQ